MEDIQLIIYIVFGVLYLIFKVMQKKKEPQQQDPDSIPQNRERRQKPQMTFEEMLREFSGEQSIPEPPIEEYAETPKTKTLPLPKKEPYLQEEAPKKYFSYETEEDYHAREVFNESVIKGEKAKTLDEQIDLENLDVGNVKLVEDSKAEKKKVTNEYIEAFRTIEGAKRAFIYSEIFNRKY